MAKRTALEIVKQFTNLDGWKNIFTGMGVKGSDRRTSSCLEWEFLTEPEADNFYAGSDIARKIVDEVVNDSFREGYVLKADDITPEVLKALEDVNQTLQIDEKLQEAWKLARLYGGSAILPVPRDITKLASPFIPEAQDEIQSLLVLSRWELPRQMIEVDIRSPNFGRPKTYRICPRSGASQTETEVHHTWLLRFDGSFLPRTLFFKNNLWHDSIMNTCKVPIRDYDAALSAVSATLDDFSVAVMKIKDLTRMVAEDQDDLIVKRMQIANLSRSVARTIMLDAENEAFEYQDRQLSGVSDCVKLLGGRLVVASNMPHTKLLGESPEGSNATGNSTTKDWYDHVRSQQKNYLDPKLIWLWKVVLSSKKSPTKGQVPEGMKAAYTPLWQEPQSVQSALRLSQAQADQIYIQNSVLGPEEIAVARFGSGEYSTETQLLDGRVPPDENPPQAPGAAPKPGSKPDPAQAKANASPSKGADPKKGEKPKKSSEG